MGKWGLMGWWGGKQEGFDGEAGWDGGVERGDREDVLMGRVKVNTVPTPSVDLAVIVPLCCSMIC